jgi:hypothetical protein
MAMRLRPFSLVVVDLSGLGCACDSLHCNRPILVAFEFPKKELAPVLPSKLL